MERALKIFTGSRNGDREREIEMELRHFPRLRQVLCRDRRFYRRQPQDAAFGRGVRRSCLRQRNEQELTPNVDAAAAAGTCGNQTNSTNVSIDWLERHEAFLIIRERDDRHKSIIGIQR
ncbi:hypothetical protein DY000_02057204 [Brassica cretica]|uniref:BRX domain-containing protein n=1 Tax=Brassica cretica TaxID=69181 RepID=A0ABQ7AGY9_BRACR|nr:hypothetical protein DY000_02057204 [Brassica cretica]